MSEEWKREALKNNPVTSHIVTIENADSMREACARVSSAEKMIGMTKFRMSSEIYKLLASEEHAAVVDNDPGLKSLMLMFDPNHRLSDVCAGNLGVIFGMPVVLDDTLGPREIAIETKSMILKRD